MTTDNNVPELTSLTFFNEEEARTIDAIAARIIPGDAEDPGAREAGALIYIDRSLSGFQRGLQSFYSRALREFDRYCREHYSAPFTRLAEQEQDSVLSSLDPPEETESREYEVQDQKDRSERVSTLLINFFTIVREQVVQGTFCDPAYGGNRDTIGWKMIGFPGAQWGYSAEQMQPGFEAEQIPVQTLRGLRQERTRTPDDKGKDTNG